MTLKTLTQIQTLVLRLMLLLEFVPICCLDLSILAASYNRCNRRGGNVSSLMMTCVVPHTLHCERVCTMTSGCKSFFYSPRTSTCRFHSDVVSSRNNETDQSTGTPDHQYYYREEGGPNNGKSEPFTRVVYGPEFYSGKHTFVQWNISSHQKTIYSHLPVPTYRITSIAYFSISRILLVSSRKPEAIWRAPVDSSSNWTIVVNDAATNMGVDEGRQLLILTGIHKGVGFLGKLYLKCNHLEKLIEKTWVMGLAVLPARQMICVGQKHTIMFLGYDGKVMKILETGAGIRVASNLSPDTDHVFYCKHKDLMQMSLSRNSMVKVVALRQVPTTLVYDGNNTLYVVAHGDFFTIDVLNRKLQKNLAIRNHLFRILVLL